MMKFCENTPFKLKEHLSISHIDDDILVFNHIDGKIYSFNKTGKKIFELIKNKVTINDIVSQMMELYHVEYSTCYNEVSNFIYELYSKHLIECYE
ncbi:MAG: PqqD family protein [Bacteroidales bacterium]|nr:PqqD family protein [Bacteroidales bacterium]